MILKDAQIRADRYEDESRRRVHTFEAELLSLKTQRDSYLSRFRSMLRDQLSLLDVISDNLGSVRGGNGGHRNADETMAEVPPQPSVGTMIDEDE